MKKTIKFLLFGLFLNLIQYSFGQDSNAIDSIRTDFKQWQPIIELEADSTDLLYEYIWGEQYQYDNWFTEEQDNDTLFLFATALILQEDNLGYFVQESYNSLSGDWFLVTDSYYHDNGQLYFVFWQYNTFQAEEPISVEKRYYYNSKGELIRELETIYKMNTKKKVDVSYFKPAINFELDLFSSECYKVWSDLY